MSCNLKQCIKKLQIIAEVKNLRLRKKLLKDVSCDEKVFEALQEIALNTVNKNVPLTKNSKKNLIKFQKNLIGLTKKVKTAKKRKSLIVQSGGFLPYILPAVLQVLSAIA